METAPRPERPWGRSDSVLAAAIVLAAFLPRLALRSHGIYTLDSAILAQAVEDYDFASYHPHPPYYPLTIAFAKLLAPALGAAPALVAFALLSTAVMALACFGVGRALGGRLAGAVSGLLVALSPLAAENGVVALSYAGEGASSALLAWLCVRVHDRALQRPRDWVGVGLAASLAVGLRPSAALFAIPLVAWFAHRNWRAWAVTVGTGALASGAWLVAAIRAGGGWTDFQFGNAYQSRVYILWNPAWVGGWAVVKNNLAWLAYHARSELPWFAVACAAALLTAVSPVPWRRRHRGLLMAWGMPQLLFYGLVYMGWPVLPSGYVMGLLPVGAVLGGVAVRRLADVAQDPLVRGTGRKLAVAGVALVALAPLAWAGHWDERLALRDRIEAWNGQWDGMEEAFPPDSTAILAGYAGPFVQVEHPDYLVWTLQVVDPAPGEDLRLQVEEWQDGHVQVPFFDNLRDGPDDPPHPVPAWVRTILLVQGHPYFPHEPVFAPEGARHEVLLPSGAHAWAVDASGFETVEDLIPNYHGGVPERAPRYFWPPGPDRAGGNVTGPMDPDAR